MPGPFADEQLATYMAQPVPVSAQPEVAAMREGSARRAAERPRGPDLHEVRDLRIGELPARLYRPVPGPVPLVVYLHGGGWTIGSLESHDRMCRRLADGSGAAVLAIEYRLAPEHPWPASVEDTVAALRWVASAPAGLGPDGLGQAPAAVAVAGSSAGGTLAALGCLRVRDEYPSALPDLQVLLYANTDLTGAEPSMREKATGWGLDAARYGSSTPSGSRTRHAGLIPRSARCMLPTCPGCLARWSSARSTIHSAMNPRPTPGACARPGVEVEVRREPGLIHGFMTLDDVSPACAAAADRVAADVRARLTRR